MSFSVVTNNNAMAALRSLSSNSRDLAATQDRISSGLKVAGAKDDASTFSIAQGMRGQIAGYQSLSNALSLGQATVAVASSAAEQISTSLNDFKKKVFDGQNTNVDTAAIQKGIKALSDQIKSITATASFNGVNLLNSNGSKLDVLASLNLSDPKISVQGVDVASALGLGGVDVTSKTAELKFDNTLAFSTGDTLTVTSNSKTFTFEFVADPTADATTKAENIAVTYDSTKSNGENLAALVDKMKEQGLSANYNDSGNIVVSSQDGLAADVSSTLTGFVSGTAAGGDPAAAVTAIDNAITKMNDIVSDLGTASNRLSAQSDFIKSLTDTLTSGVGQLVDADMAEESAKLQAAQTKQQLGIQALSIANQQPGAVVSLFRG